MSTFLTYLTESTKEYDYKIKVAGPMADNFANDLETACQKFEVKKLSTGKKTPIQEMPLDFPSLKNIEVTIYELKTLYPVSAYELREYLANYLNLAKNQIVVKKPGEPSEEYQEEMNNKDSEFVAKLQDLEYGDAPKVKAEEHYGDNYNTSLLKELLKDRKAHALNMEVGKDNKTQEVQSKEEKGNTSPLSKSTNLHPDPKRK